MQNVQSGWQALNDNYQDKILNGRNSARHRGSGWATINSITTALQRGLFEEDNNHNSEAAVTACQTVAAQSDKDRTMTGGQDRPD